MARFPFDPRNFDSMPPGMRSKPSPSQGNPNSQFQSLNASLLFCPTCKEATPVRERLLLVLPSGNKYDYTCAHCGTSTGEKTDQEQQGSQLIIP